MIRVLCKAEALSPVPPLVLRRTQRGGDLKDDLDPSDEQPKAATKAKAKAKAKGKAAKPVDAKTGKPKAKAKSKIEKAVHGKAESGEADGSVSEFEKDDDPPKKGRGRGGRGNSKKSDAKKDGGKGRGRGRGGRGSSGGRVKAVEGALLISDQEEEAKASGDANSSDEEVVKPMKRPAAARKPALKPHPRFAAHECEKKAKRTTFAGRRCPEGEIPKARFRAMLETYASMIAPELESPSQYEASVLQGLIA